MICPSCQTPQADGIRFCGKCGNPMPGMSAPAPQGGYPPPPGAYNSGPAQPTYMSGPAGQPPPGQYQAYGMGLNANEPRPELHNPKEPILLADMRVKIEGEVVPVVSVELGTQQTLYFEHHILLWKHPGVNISMQAKGGMRRLFAGLQVFISTAQGPGNIAFSREAPGQIVALRLRPGQMVEVREHQFLCASSNVNYDFTFV